MKATFYHFSPTGGTYKAALPFAHALAEEITEVDLTAPVLEKTGLEKDEVGIFAAPVFGGRIPAMAIKRMKEIHGKGAKAISFAVYGNRAFEDALIELNDCLKDQGFHVAASGAVIAQHSMLGTVAAGRPDSADEKELEEFATAVLRKLKAGCREHEVEVPGNRPYKIPGALPAVPLVADTCTGCGACAKACPARAIPADSPDQTDQKACIMCMRCVSLCPEKARLVPPLVMEKLKQILASSASLRRPNQFFL